MKITFWRIFSFTRFIAEPAEVWHGWLAVDLTCTDCRSFKMSCTNIQIAENEPNKNSFVLNQYKEGSIICSEDKTDYKFSIIVTSKMRILCFLCPSVNTSKYKMWCHLVWGLRPWGAERAPSLRTFWYWLELSALKNALFANANIKFLEESF